MNRPRFLVLAAMIAADVSARFIRPPLRERHRPMGVGSGALPSASVFSRPIG